MTAPGPAPAGTASATGAGSGPATGPGPVSAADGLASLMSASSVALVGVREESFWSRHAYRNLRSFGFRGAVHLVHPGRKEQFGERCAPSVSAIGEQIDLALVLTGPAHLGPVIEDLGRAGVPGAVSIASGLAEKGAEGRSRQDALVRECRERGVTLLGPNCVGFVDFHRGLAPFTDRIAPPMRPGGVAVVSQSGALLQLVHRAAQRNAVGLSSMFSVGNEAMVGAVDVIDALLDRDDVRTVAAYLEGMRDAARFTEVAAKALAAGKPLVVLKAGRSQSAARIALAHTGSMTGDDRVIDAVFERYGVLRVASPEELVETAAAAASVRPASGPRLAVVSSSGGACSIAADLADSGDLELPALPEAAAGALTERLPDFGTPQNPLDTTGIVVDRPVLLGECLEILADCGAYDQILVNLDLPPSEGEGTDDIHDRLVAVAEMCRRARVPVLLSSTVAGDVSPDRRSFLRDNGAHVCDGLAQAVTVAGHLAAYGRARSRAAERAAASAVRRGGGPAAPGLPRDRPALSELDSMALLGSLGLPVNPTRPVGSADEAVAAAEEFGYPVVAKIHSDTVLHKSDIGGVRTGLHDAGAVREAFGALDALKKDHDVLGVVIARQVRPVAELIAGVVKQGDWEPAVVVGTGGVLTEVVHDVAIGLAPLTPGDARELLARTRAVTLLTGVRGRPDVGTEGVERFLVVLSEAAAALGDQVAAIDINPLFVCEDGGVVPGDALVVLQEQRP